MISARRNKRELIKGAIRQEMPICPECLEVINIASTTDALYSKVSMGGQDYTVVSPFCPSCGTLVLAKYHTVH